MKPGIVITLSAAIAACISISIVTGFAPPEAPPHDTPAGARSEVADADLGREVRALRARVQSLEAYTERLRKDLDGARGAAAAPPSPEPGADASSAEPDVAADASPTDEPEPDPPENSAEAARRKAEKTRENALKALRMLLEATPEYERQQAQRTIEGVRKLGQKYGLPRETLQAIARNLIEEGSRMRTRFREALKDRDLEAVRAEDLLPLVSEMFTGRDSALAPHLDPDQLAEFRQGEIERKKLYDDWVRSAFPALGR